MGQYAEDATDETGYSNFEARMLDNERARWFVPDPANQYWSGYVAMGNNPVSRVDPDGKAVQAAPALIGLVAGAGFAAWNIALEPNSDFSSTQTWARIGTAAVAGAAMAYCPATWGGYTLLGSAGAASIINATDQFIKNGGTNNFKYTENFASMLGGAAGQTSSAIIANSVKPGTIAYSYIARTTEIGYNYHKETLSNALQRITLSPSIFLGNFAADFLAKKSNELFQNTIMIEEVVKYGNRKEPK